jgi:hypothetical protein
MYLYNQNPVAFNWLTLVHPMGGIAVIGLAIIVAIAGLRYRNARLGKSDKDVNETFNLQKTHKKAGIWFLAVNTVVLLLGFYGTAMFTPNVILSSSVHPSAGLALVILAVTSATVILRFRRRHWATPVHLILNSLIVLLLAVQLLSGVGLFNQLLP